MLNVSNDNSIMIHVVYNTVNYRNSYHYFLHCEVDIARRTLDLHSTKVLI